MRPRIKSYDEAAAFLGKAAARNTGQRGTWVVRLSPTDIAVRYHQTDVVTYHSPQVVDKVATISNGGFATPTTVARINEYAPEGIFAELRGEVHIRTPSTSVTLSSHVPDHYVVSREHSKGVT